MKNGGSFKNAFFFLCLLSLGLSAVPFSQQLIHIKPLAGENPPRLAPPSTKSWFSAKWQKKQQKYAQRAATFRPNLIRWRNQLWYALFEELPSGEVLAGKDGFLYNLNSVKSQGPVPEKLLKHLPVFVGRMKRLQDTLNAHNKQLLVVLAPSKELIYPEYLPAGWESSIANEHRASHFVRELNRQQVHQLDLIRGFQSLKKQQPHLLFSPAGLHWSEYGATLAIDSLLQKSSEVLQMPLASIQITELGLTEKLSLRDRDLEQFLNLMHYPSTAAEMAYPTVEVLHSTTKKPRLLVVGDSFYETMLATGLIDQAFDTQSAYWFYNRDVFLGLDQDNPPVSEVNLVEALEQTDLLIFLANPVNLQLIPAGFLDRVEQELYGKWSSD